MIINAENTPGHWGIKIGGEANYDQEKDVDRVKVPARELTDEQEQFTITIEKSGNDAVMSLKWGKILVEVLIEKV